MKLKIRYFANLREEANVSEEIIETNANIAQDVYHELKEKYNFSLDSSFIKLSLNQKYAGLNSPLSEGDELVFIPPVAGG